MIVTISAAEELDETRRKLEEIERRIGETARSLDEKQTEARTLADDLKTVAREETRLQELLARRRKEVADLEGRLALQKAEVASLQDRAGKTEKQVKKRLIAVYKGGEVGPLRILFAAASPARLAEDYDFLGRIVRRDRELLAGYRRQLAEVEAARRQLAQMLERQGRTLAALRQERESLRRMVRLKEKLLAQVRRDETALGALLADLRDRAARLGNLVKKLESEKPPEYTQLAGPFARQKGSLPWPVPGPIRVAFGTSRHPDLGTMQESQGIEISAAGEQPIKAVWSGRVIFANWFKGFGNLLILDHGEGFYTLYAQAARLTRKVGALVEKGDILGISGLEGADGVYFEVRHHGSPMDPAAWLSPR